MKSLSQISIVIFAFFVVAALPVFGIPLAGIKKATIRGTIVDWKWRGALNYQEQTQGQAFQCVIPSHYLIRLKIDGGRNEQHNTIIRFSRLLLIGTGMVDEDLKKDEVLIFLPTSRLEGLKTGANLTIEDYSIAADERVPWAESARILIDGKSPKPLGPAFEEAATKSTSESQKR